MNIGFRIKLARERLGWSQRDLAVKSNSSNASISRWENNARDITAQNIIALAIALEVSPNWLLTGDDYYNVDIVYERVEEEAPKKEILTLRELSDKFFSRHIPDNSSVIYVFKTREDAEKWIEHKYFKENAVHNYSIFMTIHSDFALKGIVQERWCNAEVDHFYALEADVLAAVIDVGDENYEC